MDHDDFELLSERTKQIMGDDSGGKHAFVDALIDLWRSYHEHGLSAFDFSHILHELSLGTMIIMAPLEDAEAFARFVRDGGERTRKIVSENWPPPEPGRWPYSDT